VTTYGLLEGAQIRAVDVKAANGQMHFTVQRRNGVVLPDLQIVLNLPGEHNVLNALAAISVAVELGVDDAAVVRALAGFKGVGRRFQRYGEVKLQNKAGNFTLIDDYGHHPVEMAATLAAARGAFQDVVWSWLFSRTDYSRTRDCFEDFVKVIGHGADTVLLSEVYAAGEAPIVAADSRTLVRALRVAGKIEPVFVDKIESMAQAILTMQMTATSSFAWVPALSVQCHLKFKKWEVPHECSVSSIGQSSGSHGGPFSRA
jgi:UDP-N-acetylmuramate--alanine ligase